MLFILIIYPILVSMIVVIILIVCISNSTKEKNQLKFYISRDSNYNIINDTLIYYYPKAKISFYDEQKDKGKKIISNNILMENLINKKTDTTIKKLQQSVYIDSKDCPDNAVYCEIKDKKFPRIIHQIFLGFDGPMPEHWQKNHQLWKDTHPDYEIMLWNMQDCIDLIKESEYPEFLEDFNTYKYGVQKADAARYFILQKYGGVYSDLDVIPNQKITPLLEMYEKSDKDLQVLLCESNSGHHESNWFMVSKKDAIYWKFVIPELKKQKNVRKLMKHFYILYSTGPRMLTNLCYKYQFKSVYKIPKEVLTPCTSCVKNCEQYAMLTDQHASSWNSGKIRKMNELYCSIEPIKDLNWLTWAIIVTTIFVVCFVITIFVYFGYRRYRKAYEECAAN